MRAWGLKKEHIEILKQAFEKVFRKDDAVKVFLYGSRATGKHKEYSDIDLAFQSKKPNLDKKISEIEEILGGSNFPYKFDLVNWEKIVKEYLPGIKKDKQLFWSSEEIELRSPWRICPIGQHWVRRHDRNLKSGTVVDRDGHCRKNPSKKDFLSGDEIEGIPELPIFRSPPVVVSSHNFGLKNGNKYDNLISGWTAYWNSTFQPKEPLHPNFVKALVMSESRFSPTAVAENKLKVGQARGLVQLTEQTYKILRNRKGELKDHFIDLKDEELWDPNKNICAAIRWLFRKRATARARLKREPTWEEVLWEYKGILKQNRDEKALRIKSELRDFLGAIND